MHPSTEVVPLGVLLTGVRLRTFVRMDFNFILEVEALRGVAMLSGMNNRTFHEVVPRLVTISALLETEDTRVADEVTRQFDEFLINKTLLRVNALAGLITASEEGQVGVLEEAHTQISIGSWIND